MKLLLAALIATTIALVMAASAVGHTWGGPMLFNGNNTDRYTTATEAMFFSEVALAWYEGKKKLRANAHDRINATALWVSQRSTDYSLHSCLVDWDPSPTPWSVWCYAGQRP